MSDTIEVRYVGPHMDGVEVDYAGETYVCPHGEWVSLPAELVTGTPHVLVENDDGDEEIAVHGMAGLLAQGLDDDGNGEAQWETQGGKKRKADPPAGPAAAPTDDVAPTDA